MIIIGSRAMVANGIFPGRKPGDFDIVCTYEEMSAVLAGMRRRSNLLSVFPTNRGKTFVARVVNEGIFEFSIAWGGCRESKLLSWVEADREKWVSGSFDIFGIEVPTMSLEGVLFLKESHKYLKNSPHFYKTMSDIQLLRSHGVAIPLEWKPLLADREADTYVYSHPKLNVSKGEFFDTEFTGVAQKYDHDSVHEAVAIEGEPAYKSYMVDGADVACDKTKFDALPYEKKLYGVVEEAMVLAIERSLVPFPGAMTEREAFKYALMKVCTSITSGWFRKWAWENHDAAVEMFDKLGLVAYWTLFQALANTGHVGLKR